MVGRWQTLLLVCFVSCLQQAATAKLGRRGVQLARPYLYLAVNDKATKKSLHDKMGASAKAAAAVSE